MRNKLFMATLAAAIAVPVMVAPVQAMEVAQTNITDFKDVPKNHFAYTEIMAMKKAGIINGYDDGTFKPLVGITRQHVAALISRALPLEPIREATTFKDVPTSHPYYNDIQRLYRAGIIDGSNGNFNPSASLTRAQMAKILCLAFNLEPKTGYIFTDVGADHWAKDYIATLYASGITTGSEGKFNGNETVTRAQYAVFLYRALNPDKAPIPEKPLSPDPVKPTEPTKPDPKPPTSGDTQLINPKDIVTPAGWSAEAKEKEYKQVIEETVFTHSPNRGNGGTFGTGGLLLRDMIEGVPGYFTAKEAFKITLEGFNKRGANLTEEELIHIINDVITNGTIYVHPNNSFAMYYNYEKKSLVCTM